jgi:hypothetical protein
MTVPWPSPDTGMSATILATSFEVDGLIMHAPDGTSLGVDLDRDTVARCTPTA